MESFFAVSSRTKKKNKETCVIQENDGTES